MLINMSVINEVESVILDVWKTVLNKEVIEPEQDLLALGGQSLDALKIASECQKRLQRPVTMVMVLRNRTVSGLAEVLSKP
ncbi:hypothetical protein UF13_04845 [Pantoea agglomerans]|nr:hypothetical protein UF13_04845 [Pantoea agglomerans]